MGMKGVNERERGRELRERKEKKGSQQITNSIAST